MPVVAFVRPEPSRAIAPAPLYAGFVEAENRLLRYWRAMRLCFIFVLAGWVIMQMACLSSLFLHFRSGIVAGTVDGTLAFKFWPVIGIFSPDHAVVSAFTPHVFSRSVAVGYCIILVIAGAPFCVSLFYLAELFGLFAQRDILTQRTAIVMRRIGHATMATGYSPLLLGPVAHAIGILKPVTGITDGMIAFVLFGLILLAISHVMEVGHRLRQDNEEIL